MPYRSNSRHTIRLKGRDYRRAGAYFVTICTFERRCILDDPQAQRIVRRAWTRSVCNGREPSPWDFVVMPNHIHGIVQLPGVRARTTVGARHPRDRMPFGNNPDSEFTPRLGHEGASPLHRDDAPRLISPESGSLGAIIGSFESAATKAINALRQTPRAKVWQRNYYEHIIRDEADLARIQNYILENPAKWAEDHDNPANWQTQGTEA